jgi:hypothetical protein
MKHFYLSLLLLTSISVKINAEKAIQNYFIENKGQWHNEVLYLCRINGTDAWITRNGVTYDFHRYQKIHNPHPSICDNKNDLYNRYGHVIKNEHINPNADIRTAPERVLEGYHNYFIGNKPEKWASYVNLYQQITVKNIYDGIDQKWYFDEGSLRYDYIVSPNADYRQIKIAVQGAEKSEIKQNDLVFVTRFGEVRQCKLFVYQMIDGSKKAISAKWTQNNGYFSFELGNYDPSQTLIIDPLLWSTYTGGMSDDFPYDITRDAVNNVYITGYTASAAYPTTAGVYDATHNGGGAYPYDVFVSKFNATGTTLLYSTFIGGSEGEVAEKIVVNNAGNVYLTGSTKSSDFPVTAGVYDNTYNGDGFASWIWGDVFILQLNATGSALVFSTFVGGDIDDAGRALFVDNSGNIYCAGAARSNFPVTAGAFDTVYSFGPYDGFILKMNPTATALIYCTYYGGSGNDTANGITVDDLGNAYVTGNTHSSDFPVTAGAFDTSFNGVYDGYVLKINPTGTGLVYSTYVGAADEDRHFGIVLKGNYNIVIAGFSSSISYPTTAGAYDTSHNGSYDVVLTELNASGSSLVYSTFMGGMDADMALCLTQSFSGFIYIAGYCAAGFPVTAGAYDTSHNGFEDVFIAIFNPSMSSLLYCTYIGDANFERATGIVTDNAGYPIITGRTYSAAYPTTAGAYDVTHNGDMDGFVTKLDPAIPLPTVFFTLSATLTQNNTVQLQWQYAGAEKAYQYDIEYRTPEQDTWQYLTNTPQMHCTDETAIQQILQQGKNSILYKVKALNKDGVTLAEQIREVHLSAPSTFLLYPTLNNGSFTVQSSLNTEIIIVDMQGKIVYSTFVSSGKNELQVLLSKGMYYVKARDIPTIHKFTVW